MRLIISVSVFVPLGPPGHRDTVRYSFPSHLMKMSRTKGQRALQTDLSMKIGALVHMSSRSVRQDLLPYFRWLFINDEGFRSSMVIDLELESEEIAYLLGEKVDSRLVKKMVEEARAPVIPVEKKKRPSTVVEDQPSKDDPDGKTEQVVPGTQKNIFQF